MQHSACFSPLQTFPSTSPSRAWGSAVHGRLPSPSPQQAYEQRFAGLKNTTHCTVRAPHFLSDHRYLGPRGSLQFCVPDHPPSPLDDLTFWDLLSSIVQRLLRALACCLPVRVGFFPDHISHAAACPTSHTTARLSHIIAALHAWSACAAGSRLERCDCHSIKHNPLPLRRELGH